MTVELTVADALRIGSAIAKAQGNLCTMLTLIAINGSAEGMNPAARLPRTETLQLDSGTWELTFDHRDNFRRLTLSVKCNHTEYVTRLGVAIGKTGWPLEITRYRPHTEGTGFDGYIDMSRTTELLAYNRV